MTKLSFDSYLFANELPQEIEELTLAVMRKGYSVTLIGGAPRDFIRTGKLGKDFDFELKHSMPFTEDEWKSRLKLLKKELSKKWSVEELSFQILRIQVGEYEAEFSSARREVYQGDGPFNHSDFEITLSPSLSTLESIERRDFTLNSIGIHFGAPGTDEAFELIDPLNGIEALSERKLRPIEANFYKDPVRLLRTLRFHLKYDFEITNVNFSQFDLTYLSVHWLLQEAKKSKTTQFFKMFYQTIEKNNVPVNNKIQILSALASIELHEEWNGSADELLYFLLEDGDDLQKEKFSQVGEALSTNKQYCSSLWDLFSEMDSLKPLVKKKLQSLSDKDFADSTEFKIVKSVHQFFSKYPQALPLFQKGSQSSFLESVFQIWPLGFDKELAKPDYSTLPQELRSSALFRNQLYV